MDSVPEIKIRYKINYDDLDGIKDPWELYLRVTGDFQIFIGEKLLYKEIHFCLVEFAVQLSRWIDTALVEKKDFNYKSMESDEEGLVFTKNVGDGWTIGSNHQEYSEQHIFSAEEIKVAVLGYVHGVEKDLLARNVDISKLISGETVI